MFDGVMLDVAIGLAVLFLVGSMAASAVVEAVGGWLHRRSKNLWDTIDLLLSRAEHGTGSLVDAVYRQPGIKSLVRPSNRVFYDPSEGLRLRRSVPARARPKMRTGATGDDELLRRFYGPDWIEPSIFAESLLDVFRPEGRANATLASVEARIAELPDGELRSQLEGFASEAAGDLEQFQVRVAAWYQRYMGAVSNWYRKQTRWFVFLAGLALAISFNLDALHAGTTLYRDDAVRDAVVQEALAIERITCDEQDGADADPVACLQAELDDAVSLPIGWTGSDATDLTAWGWFLRGVGWLAVAASATLGAPFWFDLLRRALRTRRRAES